MRYEKGDPRGVRERRILLISILGAVLFHVLLYFTVFPDWSKGMEVKEARKVIRISSYKAPKKVIPTPPPKVKKIDRKTVKLKPVPDPHPEEPEPEPEFILIDEEPEMDYPDDVTVVFGAPEGPPVQDGPRVWDPNEMSMPEIIKKVEPVYPKLAREMEVEGVVILQIVIGKDGLVKDAKILRKLNSLLDRAAIDAVKQWEFTPAKQAGRTVEVFFTVTVNFQLRRRGL